MLTLLVNGTCEVALKRRWGVCWSSECGWMSVQLGPMLVGWAW